MATISTVPWLSCRGGVSTANRIPSLASLTRLNGSTRPAISKRVSFNTTSTGFLHSSFLSPSSSLSSSFSGLSLGLNLSSDIGSGMGRRNRLVVRAGKAALCQTKRNRSRKSLARTHGFRLRMSTTRGRAVLKRRRAKGRKVLCTKSNPSNGKRVST